MVELKVQNRAAQVTLIPTAGAHVVKALGEPPRDRKKQKLTGHPGNLTLEQIKEIAMVMKEKSKADRKSVV